MLKQPEQAERSDPRRRQPRHGEHGHADGDECGLPGSGLMVVCVPARSIGENEKDRRHPRGDGERPLNSAVAEEAPDQPSPDQVPLADVDHVLGERREEDEVAKCPAWKNGHDRDVNERHRDGADRESDDCGADQCTCGLDIIPRVGHQVVAKPYSRRTQTDEHCQREHPCDVVHRGEQQSEQGCGEPHARQPPERDAGKVFHAPKREPHDTGNVIEGKKIRMSDDRLEKKIVGKRDQEGGADCDGGSQPQIARADDQACDKAEKRQGHRP